MDKESGLVFALLQSTLHKIPALTLAPREFQESSLC